LILSAPLRELRWLLNISRKGAKQLPKPQRKLQNYLQTSRQPSSRFDRSTTISRLARHLRFTISDLPSGYDRRQQKTHRDG
jgi:hypothetical protein